MEVIWLFWRLWTLIVAVQNYFKICWEFWEISNSGSVFLANFLIRETERTLDYFENGKFSEWAYVEVKTGDTKIAMGLLTGSRTQAGIGAAQTTAVIQSIQTSLKTKHPMSQARSQAKSLRSKPSQRKNS